MFTDSVLEVTRAQRSRRSWTTLTSFGLQAMGIGLLLLLPFWKTVGLPRTRVVSTPISAGRPDARPIANQPHGGGRNAGRNTTIIIPLTQPPRVPLGIDRGPDEAPAQPPGGPIGDGVIGIPGSPSGPSFPISGTRPVMPAALAPTAPVFRKSNMLEGSLVRRVLPVYPYAAKAAHIQGPVVLAAVISKAGVIDDLHVVSGHPLLVGAAVEAVRQWRYRPYILNSEPVEVETQITVNFTLSAE
jgi:protein TonB